MPSKRVDPAPVYWLVHKPDDLARRPRGAAHERAGLASASGEYRVLGEALKAAGLAG
jgi:hypothetical protein